MDRFGLPLPRTEPAVLWAKVPPPFPVFAVWGYDSTVLQKKQEKINGIPFPGSGRRKGEAIQR